MNDPKPVTSGFVEFPLKDSGERTIGYARIPNDVQPEFVSWNGRVFRRARDLGDGDPILDEVTSTEYFEELASIRFVGSGEFRLPWHESYPVPVPLPKLAGPCPAEALGYTCDREMGHGAVHHHPGTKYPPTREAWWILEATCECERIGRRPMSGYVLVSDALLKKTSCICGDRRGRESRHENNPDGHMVSCPLWRPRPAESAPTTEEFRPMHWRTPDGDIAAVMCTVCNTLGGHDESCPRGTGIPPDQAPTSMLETAEPAPTVGEFLLAAEDAVASLPEPKKTPGLPCTSPNCDCDFECEHRA